MIFDYCDVTRHGCGKVNSDTFESLQHRATKLIFPNSGLHTKELIAALGLVPLTNRRRLHIVSLTRKCLDGLVPPYINNYFNLNTSTHAAATRRCNNIHIPKVDLEVAKRSFSFTGATEFNSLPQRNPQWIFRTLQRLFAITIIVYFCFFRVLDYRFLNVLPPFLYFYSHFYMYFNYRTPFDTSVCYTDGVILFK